MTKRFTIKLNVNNIGPHYGDNKITFSENVTSNKAIFFALNGTGKSFISRAFRLASQVRLKPEKDLNADDLLTLGQLNGSMTFDIINKDMTKTLDVKIKKDQPATLQNNSDLIFHVFNNDFVEDNLKPNNYNPDGNIEGYILGDSQFNLIEDKAKETIIENSIDEINININNVIKNAQDDLRKAGVDSKTTEFKLLNKEQLLTNKNFNKISPFDVIIQQLNKLNNIPENLNDVTVPELTIDFSFIDEMVKVFSTQYPKSSWDEDFAAKYKNQTKFIETGLDLVKDKETCPFCGQSLDNKALNLIQQYKAYQKDREAETIKLLDEWSSKVSDIIEFLENCPAKISLASSQINNIKQYFPSIEKDMVPLFSEISERTLQPFNQMLSAIDDKRDDLTKVPLDLLAIVQEWKESEKSIRQIFKNNSDIIENVNRIKTDKNSERLFLRRNLCKAKFLLCQADLNPIFENLTKVKNDLSDLQIAIKEKENRYKVSKRDKVYDSLTYFLNLFFCGKYTLNKDTFQINFLGHTIGEKISRVLSDGEKSIVAFCYYLASTHSLMQRQDDYEKLFFIIDDPISSMDFHHVYMVAQSIRDIKRVFGITKHERIWIFTHNIEFFSIMRRNKIIFKTFVLRPGKIEPIEHQLLMPYNSHLNDIVLISKGKQNPNHTTPNSIRHILETICKFEYPTKDIKEYISENEILSNDSSIYSFCHDMSHGNIRNQYPITDDMLINACKTIVDFMKTKYQGQLNAIQA